MFISITSSKVTPDEGKKVEKFLNRFLPRLKQQPGVHAIYHYSRPDKGDETTVIIWKDEDSLKRYRKSDWVKEAMAFEQQMNLPSTREAYPLLLAIVS